MESKLYVVFSENNYSKVVRMTEAQAKAINWIIDEFNLEIVVELAEECYCDDLAEVE